MDIGCGVLGWLRLLSEWVGPDGEVVETDIDESILAAATQLGPASFDLVHARFELTPLGRGQEQLQTYVCLLRPGGTVVVEDPDWGSWRFNPPALAGEKLIPR